MTLEEFKNFYHQTSVVHLNNAGMSPPHPILRRVTNDLLLRAEREGCRALPFAVEAYQRSLESFAKIIGCSSAEVAMVSTCAVALSQAAFGIPISKGQEILSWHQEYPSNAYPWIVRARETGALLKRLPANDDWSVNTDRLIEAIGPQTRIVALSWVQFQTGAVSDLKKITEAVRGKDIWVVVDVMQGMGVIPFDMTALGIDVVCGATQKWMCGPVGQGFLAIKRERIAELRPLFYGAMTFATSEDAVDTERLAKIDARRFEPGSFLLAGTLGAATVIEELLSLGLPNIHREALRLADLLQRGLERRGHRVLRNPESASLRSPIVTAIPPQEISRVETALQKHQITFAKRAGGFRYSPHAFNTEEDLERVFGALDEC